MVKNYENFSQVKDRLDSIVDKVNDEDISLDEALDLYDEAVKLAMRASDLIEIDTGNDIESEQKSSEGSLDIGKNPEKNALSSNINSNSTESFRVLDQSSTHNHKETEGN